MIDRVPDIDSASAEGLKPDGIKGEVRIKIQTQTKSSIFRSVSTELSSTTLLERMFQFSEGKTGSRVM